MSTRFTSTRNQLHVSLTATASAQEEVFDSSIQKAIFEVTTGSGQIRISINGTPATIDGTTGILITEGQQLIINDHIIHKISYIRVGGSDIDFQVFGMFNLN